MEINDRKPSLDFVYITCVIQCVKANFGPDTVTFEIPDQKFGMGEPALSTLL